MDAATNYHILSHLRQQKFILSPFWRQKVQNLYHWAKIKMSTKLRSLQELWGESTPCLFQFLVAAAILCLCGHTAFFLLPFVIVFRTHPENPPPQDSYSHLQSLFLSYSRVSGITTQVSFVGGSGGIVFGLPRSPSAEEPRPGMQLHDGFLVPLVPSYLHWEDFPISISHWDPGPHM